MKKALLIISTLFLLAASASAQDEFTPRWNLQVKGGVAETLGEASFGKLLNPNAGLGFGYQFTPVFGLRMEFGGWQAKGGLPATGDVYKFNYVQDAIDATFDLCNLFGGYKSRVVNPYLFAGIGAVARFNNTEANALAQKFPAENKLWDGTKFGTLARLGIGIDFAVSDNVSIVLEAADNMYNDNFNSKKGSYLDQQFTALAGVKFNFGKKKVAPAPVPVPAPVPEAKPEPKPEPAPVVVVKEPEYQPLNIAKNIYFIIGQWEIRSTEQLKVEEIAKIMKDEPKSKVIITGYADKQTGSAKRNMFLSQMRAEVVTEALVKLGIDKDRISYEFKGSEENPFATPEENRVAVCLVK